MKLVNAFALGFSVLVLHGLSAKADQPLSQLACKQLISAGTEEYQSKRNEIWNFKSSAPNLQKRYQAYLNFNKYMTDDDMLLFQYFKAGYGSKETVQARLDNISNRTYSHILMYGLTQQALPEVTAQADGTIVGKVTPQGTVTVQLGNDRQRNQVIILNAFVEQLDFMTTEFFDVNETHPYHTTHDFLVRHEKIPAYCFDGAAGPSIAKVDDTAGTKAAKIATPAGTVTQDASGTKSAL